MRRGIVHRKARDGDTRRIQSSDVVELRDVARTRVRQYADVLS
jgi:hypothetical protein